MSTEVGGWSKKGEIMSMWLLNAPLLCEKCKLCHYSIKGDNPSQSLGINDIDSETVLASLSVQANIN